MTEKDRLEDVFVQLGIGGKKADWVAEGIDLRSDEGKRARLAGMPMEAVRAASASIEVVDNTFYFDREGRYLGLVAGEETLVWEGRQ